MGLSSFFHSVAVVLLVAAIFTVQLGLVTAGIYGYFSVIYSLECESKAIDCVSVVLQIRI